MPAFFAAYGLRIARAKVEADEDAFAVGKVADDAANWGGEFADEGGDGEDLIAVAEGWVFEEIDHFDGVAAFEMLFADFAKVLFGGEAAGGFACDVKAKEPTFALSVF